MEKIDINQTIAYSNLFEMVLAKGAGEKSDVMYAHYENDGSELFCDLGRPRIGAFSFEIYREFSFFDYILMQDRVIIYIFSFTKNDYTVRVLSKDEYIQQKHFIFNKRGAIENGKGKRNSLIRISNNSTDFLYTDQSDNLINHNFYKGNERFKVLEDIHKEIVKRGYHITPELTSKEFYRDIVRHVYPQMELDYVKKVLKDFKGEVLWKK